MQKILGIIVFGLLIFAVTARAEEIKVAGGAAPTENVFKKIQAPMEQALGLKLVIIDNGPYEALIELDKGTVDGASAGLAFGDWMSMMQERGYAIADQSIYKYRVIGKDVVCVITNKDAGVSTLDKAQLKQIFTGAVTNWKEVGGADMPIKVVFGTKIPGTQAVFQKQIMEGAAYSSAKEDVGTAVEVKAKVVAAPGAVGLAPSSLVDASVGAPQMPEVGRPITFITKGAPSPAVGKLFGFISGEGKKYLDM